MTRPIHRATLGDEAYEAVRSLVMEHSLAPGDRLNIDALARKLVVSPTPLREALARLEVEGLVRKRPLAGYTVSPLLTRAEFTDLFEVRELLEGAAARRAAERAGEQARAAIEHAAAEPVRPGRSDAGWASHAAFTAADARLHELIAQASGSPLLGESIGRLHAHLHLHRLYVPYTRAGETVREHRRIAAAIVAGRPDEAAAAMQTHLACSRDRHLPAFD